MISLGFASIGDDSIKLQSRINIRFLSKPISCKPYQARNTFQYSMPCPDSLRWNSTWSQGQSLLYVPTEDYTSSKECHSVGAMGRLSFNAPCKRYYHPTFGYLH